MHAQTLGAPAGGQGTCLCATRFMAPRVRDRIKTPAAAASAAGGTWMGPHVQAVVSCMHQLWEPRFLQPLG